jgi:predicted TPR repeat methyltransferase
VVLKAAGRLDEAAAAYARALAIDPAHVNALINLGVLARMRGQPEEAEAAYRNALRLAPGHAEAYSNLRLLGNAYYVAGQRENAIEVFESCLRYKPDDPVARHMLAACSGRGVPERAPDAYVLATFDGFAESFDQRLAELGYRAPQLVTEAVAAAGLAPNGCLVVLDAGCGTGLCGPLLAPYSARLIGVDLSGAMLDKARERGAYHELVKGELTAYLAAHPHAHDLVVSADTLVYFGALEHVVALVATALRPGGRFVYTVEELAEDATGEYRLQPHGRYAHRADYVQQVSMAAGLEPTIVRAQIRTEAGAPVAGLVVCAAMPADPSCRTGADATRNLL